MKNKIFYKRSVNKDLKRIDLPLRLRIMSRLETELSGDITKGKKLKGEFKEFYSLRVGKYRVIYAMIPDGVLVVRISHRKESYR